MDSLLDAQSVHEKRYNCIVCMEARLEMVYGSCQHRLCSSCLYMDSGTLKQNMDKCPVCAKHLAFPQTRPVISWDTIEMQRYLGVRDCPNKEQGCKCQLWDWEIEDHLIVCQFEKPVRTCYQQKNCDRVMTDKSTAQSRKCRVRNKQHFCDRKIQQSSRGTERRSARISSHRS